MDNKYILNIERAVLCSIFFDQSLIEDVLGVLKPQDFYIPEHQKIFEIMEKLNNQDIPLDEEFIRKELVNTDVSDNNLIEILSTNSISNPMAYVKEIKNAAIKRELFALSISIQKTVSEDNITAQESVDKIQNELYKITLDSNSSDLKDMLQIINATKEHIKEIQNRGTTYLTGQTTGFYSLDKKTTGFNPGDLVIIAARPAMGKTAIVLNTTLKNLEQGDGVIFFSLEMPETQLMTRLLSIKTGIPLQNLRKGQLDPIQAKQLEHAFKDMENKKLFVDDNGNLNINQLRARARKIAQNEDNNIKMIVVDYLQLMSGSGGNDRRLTVDEISRGLKLLAREINIPIVALSQLNRGLESRPDKRPMLSDIRESGAIEQDADIIAFVYRDDIYKERDEQRKEKEASDKGETYKSAFINKPIEEAEIIIGKQRNGSIGTVKLDFHKELTKFVDKDIEFSNMPEIVTYNGRETDVDISEIINEDDTPPFEYENQIDIPDIF